jgi:hypothetical protein
LVQEINLTTVIINAKIFAPILILNTDKHKKKPDLLKNQALNRKLLAI